MDGALAWAIGLAVLSFSLKSIGYTLQKKGVNEIRLLDKKTGLLDYLGNPHWMAGLALPFAGGAILLAAYSFGPISAIMPFMGTGMVVLVLFCRFFLKESIEKAEWLSVMINLSGIALIGVFGGGRYVQSITFEDALQRIGELKSIAMMGIPALFSLIAMPLALSRNTGRAGAVLGITAGVIGGASLIIQKPMARGLAEIILEGDLKNAGGTVLSAVIVIILTVLAVWSLTQAFHRGKAIVVAPVYSAIQMIYPMLGGIFIYSEWELLSALEAGFEICGMTLVTASIVIISVYNEKRIGAEREGISRKKRNRGFAAR